MVNPNTLGGKPKVYGGTNLGGKSRLSYINLVSSLRALASMVLKNYIAIFSTINHKNGAAIVEL